MALPSDRKGRSRFYDVENTDDKTVGFMEEGDEYQSLLIAAENEQHRKNLSSGWVHKFFIAFIFGSSLPLIWMFHGLLHDCVPAHQSPTHHVYDESVSPTFHLVKDAISATTGVLETFQVYQPVFTPSGAIDETISSNGSGNTTTIAPTAQSTSCQVVLMDHSFGFSYGIPFVGQSSQTSRLSSLTSQCRSLHSTSMQVHPGHDEFHSHLQRTPI